MKANDNTLAGLLCEFWQGRFFILTGLAAGLLAAAIFLLSAAPHYKAEMVLAPANPMNGAEVSSLLADDNLFALRYLVQRAGVGNSSDFMRFESIYAGPSVAAELLKDPQIRQGLAADRTFLFSEGFDRFSPEALADYIGKRVRLSPVGATPLRRMQYEHPGRAFGPYFLERIHELTDEHIRRKLRADAARRVAYLQKAIGETKNPEHRRALTTLLLEQERLLMLASIESPYAAAVVEPPSAGIKPSWPKIWLVLPGFMAVGAFIGYVLFGLRRA